MNQLQQILERAGVTQYGIIDTKDIHFSQEVRHMCEVNTCRQYGKTWSVPRPGHGGGMPSENLSIRPDAGVQRQIRPGRFL